MRFKYTETKETKNVISENRAKVFGFVLMVIFIVTDLIKNETVFIKYSHTGRLSDSLFDSCAVQCATSKQELITPISILFEHFRKYPSFVINFLPVY